MLTCFSWRDQVPTFMLEPDRNQDVDTIYFTMVIMHAVNYNEFLATILINPILYLTSYYFMLIEEVELWTDPFTLVPFADQDAKDTYVFDKMINLLTLVLLVNMHSYLI